MRHYIVLETIYNTVAFIINYNMRGTEITPRSVLKSDKVVVNKKKWQGKGARE